MKLFRLKVAGAVLGLLLGALSTGSTVFASGSHVSNSASVASPSTTDRGCNGCGNHQGFERHHEQCCFERHHEECCFERHHEECCFERHHEECCFERNHEECCFERHHEECCFERHHCCDENNNNFEDCDWARDHDFDWFRRHCE